MLLGSAEKGLFLVVQDPDGNEGVGVWYWRLRGLVLTSKLRHHKDIQVKNLFSGLHK